jgi:hypothetical protein
MRQNPVLMVFNNFMFLQRMSSRVYPLFMHCHNTTWVEIVLKKAS